MRKFYKSVSIDSPTLEIERSVQIRAQPRPQRWKWRLKAARGRTASGGRQARRPSAPRKNSLGSERLTRLVSRLELDNSLTSKQCSFISQTKQLLRGAQACTAQRSRTRPAQDSQCRIAAPAIRAQREEFPTASAMRPSAVYPTPPAVRDKVATSRSTSRPATSANGRPHRCNSSAAPLAPSQTEERATWGGQIQTSPQYQRKLFHGPMPVNGAILKGTITTLQYKNLGRSSRRPARALRRRRRRDRHSSKGYGCSVPCSASPPNGHRACHLRNRYRIGLAMEKCLLFMPTERMHNLLEDIDGSLGTL